MLDLADLEAYKILGAGVSQKSDRDGGCVSGECPRTIQGYCARVSERIAPESGDDGQWRQERRRSGHLAGSAKHTRPRRHLAIALLRERWQGQQPARRFYRQPGAVDSRAERPVEDPQGFRVIQRDVYGDQRTQRIQ